MAHECLNDAVLFVHETSHEVDKQGTSKIKWLRC